MTQRDFGVPTLQYKVPYLCWRLLGMAYGRDGLSYNENLFCSRVKRLQTLDRKLELGKIAVIERLQGTALAGELLDRRRGARRDPGLA
jgi:hypothetical protein